MWTFRGAFRSLEEARFLPSPRNKNSEVIREVHHHFQAHSRISLTRQHTRTSHAPTWNQPYRSLFSLSHFLQHTNMLFSILKQKLSPSFLASCHSISLLPFETRHPPPSRLPWFLSLHFLTLILPSTRPKKSPVIEQVWFITHYRHKAEISKVKDTHLVREDALRWTVTNLSKVRC